MENNPMIWVELGRRHEEEHDELESCYFAVGFGDDRIEAAHELGIALSYKGMSKKEIEDILDDILQPGTINERCSDWTFGHNVSAHDERCCNRKGSEYLECPYYYVIAMNKL